MHNPIKKHRGASKKYRIIQAALDREHIFTEIVRTGPKAFAVYVNFEVAKRYKQRRSCNNYLVKLLQKA